MPRKHRRAPDGVALEVERVRRGMPMVEPAVDGLWLVRSISAEAATKAYRCPGCDLQIAPGVAHVVAYPADERGDAADRRHWHTGCWSARARRVAPVRRWNRG